MLVMTSHPGDGQASASVILAGWWTWLNTIFPVPATPIDTDWTLHA